MTVAELIEALKAFPQDKQVYISDSEQPPEPMTIDAIRENRKYWQDFYKNRGWVDKTTDADDFILLG